MRLRQAMDVKDPEPTSALLDETRVVSPDKSCCAPDGTRAMRGEGSFSAQGESLSDERKNGLEAGGDENYYALNSHLCGGGVVLEQEGKAGRARGLGGNTCGQGGNARGMGRNVCGRSEGQGGERAMRMRIRQRRERMRRMLDGCGNTFKDVFDRIDAMLDGS